MHVASGEGVPNFRDFFFHRQVTINNKIWTEKPPQNLMNIKMEAKTNIADLNVAWHYYDKFSVTKYIKIGICSLIPFQESILAYDHHISAY